MMITVAYQIREAAIFILAVEELDKDMIYGIVEALPELETDHFWDAGSSGDKPLSLNHEGWDHLRQKIEKVSSPAVAGRLWSVQTDLPGILEKLSALAVNSKDPDIKNFGTYLSKRIEDLSKEAKGKELKEQLSIFKQFATGLLHAAVPSLVKTAQH